jgi:hypothetical protein
MTQTVRVYLFLSAKGGVGKSTLAVTAAAAIAARGGRAVVLDADFTGTSLADGLDLRAPRLRSGPTGLLELRPPDLGVLTLHETRQARDQRENAKECPYALPYLNDAILHPARGLSDECHLPTMAWTWDPLPEVRFLPSSPLRRDVDVALNWLYRRPRDRQPWEARVRSLVRALRLQDPRLTDVVIDLAPGIFGLTAAVLEGVAALPPQDDEVGVAWRVVPVLVMTEDRHDLRVAAPAFVPLLHKHRHALAVFNRSTTSLEPLRRRFTETLGIRADWVPDTRLPRMIGEVRDLGQLFRDGGGGPAKATCDVVAWALQMEHSYGL